MVHNSSDISLFAYRQLHGHVSGLIIEISLGMSQIAVKGGQFCLKFAVKSLYKLYLLPKILLNRKFR